MELPTPVLLATGAGESAPPSSLFSRVFRAASSAVSSPLQWTSEFARPIADLALPGSPPADADEVGLSSPLSPKKRRRVRFQDPDIIEVTSWKDETKQMYFNSIPQDDLLEDAAELLMKQMQRFFSSRFAVATSSLALAGIALLGMSENLTLLQL